MVILIARVVSTTIQHKENKMNEDLKKIHEQTEDSIDECLENIFLGISIVCIGFVFAIVLLTIIYILFNIKEMFLVGLSDYIENNAVDIGIIAMKIFVYTTCFALVLMFICCVIYSVKIYEAKEYEKQKIIEAISGPKIKKSKDRTVDDGYGGLYGKV